MKTLAALLLLIASVTANASDLSAFYKQEDKQLHTKYSAVGVNLMYIGGMSKWQAFTVMMVIGGIKETMDGDRNSTKEHHKDMFANMAGAATVFPMDWMLSLRNDKVTISYRKEF